MQCALPAAMYRKTPSPGLLVGWDLQGFEDMEILIAFFVEQHDLRNGLSRLLPVPRPRYLYLKNVSEPIKSPHKNHPNLISILNTNTSSRVPPLPPSISHKQPPPP